MFTPIKGAARYKRYGRYDPLTINHGLKVRFSSVSILVSKFDFFKKQLIIF